MLLAGLVIGFVGGLALSDWLRTGREFQRQAEALRRAAMDSGPQ